MLVVDHDDIVEQGVLFASGDGGDERGAKALVAKEIDAQVVLVDDLVVAARDFGELVADAREFCAIDKARLRVVALEDDVIIDIVFALRNLQDQRVLRLVIPGQTMFVERQKLC